MGEPLKIAQSEVQVPVAEHEICKEQLGDALDAIALQAGEAHQLSLRIDKLEARLQTTTDLTDDLLTNANTLVTSVGDRADVTMQQAELVLTEADTLVSVYLVAFSILAGVASVAVTYLLGRKREEHLREAVEQIAESFGSDDGFQQQFIRKLAKNKNIAANIEYAIQQAVQQKVEGLNDASDISDKLS